MVDYSHLSGNSNDGSSPSDIFGHGVSSSEDMEPHISPSPEDMKLPLDVDSSNSSAPSDNLVDAQIAQIASNNEATASILRLLMNGVKTLTSCPFCLPKDTLMKSSTNLC